MKNLNDFTQSFDEFIAEAEEYFKQLQTRSEVIPDEDVPLDLKYKQYVPAYQAKQAYSKFVEQKESNSLTWLKVKSGEYQETVFATMIKNNDLGEKFKNKWMLFDAAPIRPEQLENKMILAYHPSIADKSYKKKGLTFKTFNFKEETRKEGMFDEIVSTIILSNFVGEITTIKQGFSDFKLVGVML